ncbi:hypothetical protein Z043_101582 [Scleropages formosus]|uniref:Uncharacterized protein n=1 Tax=Scleropages formosus TaxID=113540 RepID=A0A0P7XPR1_SCLFO|nr:hypothetical protein Z043_101582 [Scleropages formosus]
MEGAVKELSEAAEKAKLGRSQREPYPPTQGARDTPGRGCQSTAVYPKQGSSSPQNRLQPSPLCCRGTCISVHGIPLADSRSLVSTQLHTMSLWSPDSPERPHLEPLARQALADYDGDPERAGSRPHGGRKDFADSIFRCSHEVEMSS